MFGRRSVVLSLALLSAAPLMAQTVTAPRAPRPTKSESLVIVVDSMRFRLDTLRSSAYFFRDSMQPMMARAFASRRVRIGVVVNTQPAETDSIGALLDAVTPGGPAAAAGLMAGDIITRFGKTSLAVDLSRVSPGDRVQSPGFRLIELVAKLAPNDTVPLAYRRGKKQIQTQVVTAAMPDNIAVVVGPEGNYAFRSMPGGEEYWVGRESQENQRALELALLRSEAVRGGADLPFSLYRSRTLRDLELAPVNPQLGSYFGTTEGVLVVNVPDPAPLGLKAGDVVVGADGRAVTSPRQLMRILGSYEPGEPIKLEVMRQKKRIVLKGTLGR